MALYGYWGGDITLTDGRYTYHRAPQTGTNALRAYTALVWDFERWFGPPTMRNSPETSTLPYAAGLVWKFKPEDIEGGEIAAPSDRVLLFDSQSDPDQHRNLALSHMELATRLRERLAAELHSLQAPEELHVRFNL